MKTVREKYDDMVEGGIPPIGGFETTLKARPILSIRTTTKARTSLVILSVSKERNPNDKGNLEMKSIQFSLPCGQQKSKDKARNCNQSNRQSFLE